MKNTKSLDGSVFSVINPFLGRLYAMLRESQRYSTAGKEQMLGKRSNSTIRCPKVFNR